MHLARAAALFPLKLPCCAQALHDLTVKLTRFWSQVALTWREVPAASAIGEVMDSRLSAELWCAPRVAGA